MALGLLAVLAIAVALQVIAYLIMPKPKAPKPDSAKDMDNPTSDAGRELPVIFGTVTVKGLNVLDYSDKSIRTYKVKA